MNERQLLIVQRFVIPSLWRPHHSRFINFIKGYGFQTDWLTKAPRKLYVDSLSFLVSRPPYKCCALARESGHAQRHTTSLKLFPSLNPLRALLDNYHNSRPNQPRESPSIKYCSSGRKDRKGNSSDSWEWMWVTVWVVFRGEHQLFFRGKGFVLPFYSFSIVSPAVHLFSVQWDSLWCTLAFCKFA